MGIKVGDKFNVEVLEILDGEILPTTLGIVTVTALKGEAIQNVRLVKKKVRQSTKTLMQISKSNVFLL